MDASSEPAILNNAMYIDPFNAPARYLSHLVSHLPVMWLATFSPVPPSLVWMAPKAIPILAIFGTAVFALIVAGLWSSRNRGFILWALAFYLLALLPQMSSDAMSSAA